MLDNPNRNGHWTFSPVERALRDKALSRRAYRTHRFACLMYAQLLNLLDGKTLYPGYSMVQRREAQRAAKRRWSQRNPEVGRAKCVKRRALKLRAAIGDLAAITKIYRRAQELRRWFDVVVDHIVPLSRGGAHSPENLQIIYRHENGAKGARLDYTPSVVFT